MRNKEIEIKIRVTENQFNNLKSLLAIEAKKVDFEKQTDTYYSPQGKAFINKDGSIYEWLRLREEGHHSTLTYKFVYDGENHKGRQKDEYETEVKDLDQMDRILKALKFEELIKFSKERITYIYKDKYEISLDYVTELGYFIEIELKTEIEDPETELEKIASELNIDIKNESLLGYAHLIMIQRGIADIPEFVKNSH